MIKKLAFRLFKNATLIPLLYALTSITKAEIPAPPAKLIVYFDSYTPDMSWVQGIEKAIEEGFKPIASYEIKKEHLNSKFYNDPEYFASVANIITKRYEGKTPELILASDDWAVAFLLKYRDRIFPGKIVPVVFCGVNDPRVSFPKTTTEPEISAAKEDLLKRGFTGYFEKPGALETLQLIRAVHPACKKVFAITDSLEKTGVAWKKTIDLEKSKIASDWIIDTQTSPLASLNLLEDEINGLDPASSVILLGAYFSDPERSIESYETTTDRICSVARRRGIPVYGMLAFHKDHGAWGGYELSGYSEGVPMVNRAMSLLRNNASSPNFTLPPIEEMGGTPSPRFNYHNFSSDQSQFKERIYDFLRKQNTPETKIKLGLAPSTDVWIKEEINELLHQPWVYVLATLVIWYLLVFLIAHISPSFVFEIYCLAENPFNPLADFAILAKPASETITLLMWLALFPILLTRDGLRKWWLTTNSPLIRNIFINSEAKIKQAIDESEIKVPYTIQCPARGDSKSPGFDASDFKRILSKHREIIILGRGGSGKSTLAFQIAVAAISGELGDHPIIPILIGAPAEIAEADVESYICGKIRATIVRYSDARSSIPEDWIRYLCHRGSILCIFDGLSEMPKEFRAGIEKLIGNSKFAINRVIYTSRSHFDIQAIPCIVDVLVNDSLTAFVAAYFHHQLYKEKTLVSHKSKTKPASNFLAQQWKLFFDTAPMPQSDGEITAQLGVKIANSLFGDYTDCRATALFVRLRLKCVITQQPFSTLVDLASNYVSECRDRLGSQTPLCSLQDAISIFSQVAWVVISSNDTFCCDTFSRHHITHALENKVNPEYLGELLDKYYLIEVVDADSKAMRFVDDPIAEYLAPIGWLSLPHTERIESWNNLGKAALEIPENRKLEMRGTIMGFYYYWNSMPDSDKLIWPWSINLPRFDIRKIS